ncbi:serine hydrolase [Actinomadura geliboluensis]
MAQRTRSSVESEITEVFRSAGARGFLHAREVGVSDGPEIGVGADDLVVLASVFKVPVAIAYAREVAAGRLDESERVTVTSKYRVGGIGTAGCADDVTMTWRDLALFMMTMSDNAATDLIFRRIGQPAVDQVLLGLGLHRTRLIGCCEDLFASIAADLGGDDHQDPDAALAAAGPDELWQLTVLDPARTTASTPREVTALLEAIWTDVAGPPTACDQVRNIMGRQIWPHRLGSGFEPDVHVAAKTGTLPAIRNEAGVLSYPDGKRYAVAVFTRADSLADRLPRVDASIGRAARLAVDELRKWR